MVNPLIAGIGALVAALLLWNVVKYVLAIAKNVRLRLKTVRAVSKNPPR